MTDTQTLHNALLRPAILHILRASGFHSTKSIVLDTLTDLCARYLLLLAQRTAQFTYDRTAIPHIQHEPLELSSRPSSRPVSRNSTSSEPANTSFLKQEVNGEADAETQSAAMESTSADSSSLSQGTGLGPTPTTADLLGAFTSLNFFTQTSTPAEEAWRESLRRPLSDYPSAAAREKERLRRDAEDTRDVREFVDWCTGDAAAEMRRVAGLEVKRVEAASLTGPAAKEAVVGMNIAGAVADPGTVAVSEMAIPGEPVMEKVYPDDYVVQMKKKYSRTGDGARYAGTVLGSKHGREGGADRGVVRIEGGPESLKDWKEMVKRARLDERFGGKRGMADVR